MNRLARQNTGTLLSIPRLFCLLLAIGCFGLAAVSPAQGASPSPTTTSSSPVLRDGDDWEALIDAYLRWLLEQLGSPQPTDQSTNAMMAAIISAYYQNGMPEVAPEDQQEFLDNLIQMQALLTNVPQTQQKNRRIIELGIVIAEMILQLEGSGEHGVGA